LRFRAREPAAEKIGARLRILCLAPVVLEWSDGEDERGEGDRTCGRPSREPRLAGVIFMKTIMVRYKTSEASSEVNATLVRAVFEELRARAPEGLRYASYRLPDGVTFVHVAIVESTDQNPLVTLPSFKAFQAQLKERCVEPPVVTELSPVGSYGVGS
jgi:hypothetical protein